MASLAGTVQDTQQGVVVGAVAKLSSDKGISLTATSNDQGEYNFKDLPPGTYALTVTAEGFKEFKTEGIILAAGQTLRMDVTLEPAGVVTQTTVEGQVGAQVETEQSQISGTITQKELVKIGLNGRNFTQLIALAPGVSNQTGQDEAKVGVQGSVKYSVNGGRVEYNNFDVDGQDVLNAGINGSQSTLIVYPNLDSLAEVQVLTSNYGAQYGKTASGTILASTKTGGTEFHGDVFYFNRNEIFNARNFFDQTRRAPLYRKNDVGFTLGGPFYYADLLPRDKSKTFFFWSEDWRIEEDPTGYTYNRAVPSLAERAGSFADVCPNGPDEFLRSQFPDCPAQAVAGSTVTNIPIFQTQGRPPDYSVGVIDPIAQAILNANLIPAPNSTTGCNSTIQSCFDATVSPLTHWRQDLARVDHNFTNNEKLSFRFIHDSWSTTVPFPQWALLVNSFPTVQNDFKGPGTAVMASLSQTLSTTLLNQLEFGYTGDHITLKNIAGYGGATSVRTSEFDAMGNIYNNGFGNKIPSIALLGNNRVYGGTGFNVDTGYMPWKHSNPTYTIRDDLTKVWGKHTLRFGALALIAQRNEINPPVGSVTGDQQGIAYFSNITNTATTGNVFADFLLGRLGSFQQDSAQHKYYQRYNIAEPYLQDDWHITPRLTLNLGLRLSLFGNWHEKYNNVYNWEASKFNVALADTMHVDPVIGFLQDNATGLPIAQSDPRLLNGFVHCGTNGVPSSCINSHIFNPEPRIGFAWSPFGSAKTSIRGGYGIFYEHGTGNEANTGSLEGSAPLVQDGTQYYPGTYEGVGSAAILGQGIVNNLTFPLNVTSIPTNTLYPNVQQWSFGIQQELPQHFILGAGYVGSKGTHLTAQLQLNQLQPAPVSLNAFQAGQPISYLICGILNSGGTQGLDLNNVFHVNGVIIGPGDPAYQNLVAACNGHEESHPLPLPLPLKSTLPTNAPNVGNIYSLQNIANSTYHALQMTTRKVAGPLVLGVSYSYSHSIDDSSDRTDNTFVNSYDIRANRASSNFDQRHLLAVSFVYQVPVKRAWSALTSWADDDTNQLNSQSSHEESGFTKRLFEGWEFSGIVVRQSGTPFSIINGGSPNGVGVLDNAGVVNNIGVGSFPDLVAGPHAPVPGSRAIAGTFGPLLGNPNAFAAPTGLTFGDVGRNSYNNPARTNFDLAVLKSFQMAESRRLELRLETFNTFNHTQFRIYNPDRGNVNNTISCYGGPNNLAGYTGSDENCLVGNSFLHPVDAHRPRTLQLGIKFNF